MSTILEQERATYDAMWAVPAYADHSPGATFLPLFVDIVGASTMGARTVLDAGTGSGRGALALQAAGFRVLGCDVTDAGLVPEARSIPFKQACLWDDLRPVTGFHDYVYCCDVMEHIPPAFTMLVVSRLLEVARGGVFFSISLVPDSFGSWVGKPLHQTVQSFAAWRDQLNTVGCVREARDLLTTGIYFVEGK